jgi:tryptophan synthase alpha chain
MNLSERFGALSAKGEKALVLYVTAGDPPLDQLPAILSALEEGGADVIEVGLPFSDPIADGPTIQASTQRALEAGTTPTAVLEALAQSKVSAPILTMGYYNTILRFGLTEAARKLHEAGVSGTIISDLTPEESDPWVTAAKAQAIDSIFLAAPTSTDARLDEVCRRSAGFVYAVSRTGVTGAGSEVPADVRTLVARLKARTPLPICVGFGISRPEHVRMVCEVADGAVIGSWLVDLLHREWNGGSGRAEIVNRLQALKAATKG